LTCRSIPTLPTRHYPPLANVCTATTDRLSFPWRLPWRWVQSWIRGTVTYWPRWSRCL